MLPSLADLERDALLLRRRLRSTSRPLTPAETDELNRQTAAIRQAVAQHMVERLVVNRDEVVSKGNPVAGLAAKRGLHEARTRLERRREFRLAESRCPAARVTKAADGAVLVRCNVEQSDLSSRTDPQSVLTFCLGDHELCPSWRAQKEAQWAGRRLAVA